MRPNRLFAAAIIFAAGLFLSPFTLYGENAGTASDNSGIIYLNALFSDGQYEDILYFDETISAPDSSSAKRQYTAYVFYLKGKAAENLFRREDAVYYYRQVKTVEQGLNADNRLLTLLSDISLTALLLNAGEKEAAVEAVSEIILLKKNLPAMTAAFYRCYNIEPPSEEKINSRIEETLSPYFVTVKFGNTELLMTTWSPGSVNGKPGILIVYQEGLFRVISNQIFATQQEARNYGNTAMKKAAGLTFIIKTYGSSQYGVQFGAYENLYSAYKKAAYLEDRF